MVAVALASAAGPGGAYASGAAAAVVIGGIALALIISGRKNKP